MNTNSIYTIDKTLHKAIIGTLGYYSLFGYPITMEEILASLPEKSGLISLSPALEELVYSSEIYSYNGYYCLESDVKNLTLKRDQANKLAKIKIPGAIRVGAFICKFPFVRFVGISGSLSKGFADKNSDFDFFIVTEKNRLWICRTLLHLFKKITFLTGQQHKFCMNYFIDTNNLEIEDKNRYTAIELASVVPAAGNTTYEELKEANHWVKAYLPNGYKSFYPEKPIQKESVNLVKKTVEFIFNFLSPEKLNDKLMQLTDKRWKKKWAKKNFPMEEYNTAFKTTLHISKNHPANYQKRVLEAISKFEN